MSELSERERQELRWRAQTDLFFLGRDILHYDLEEQPHRQMCDFLVAKDPRKTIGEQSEIKERQELLSRGTFKSTINVIDSVQWIICFPDIRILCLTGEQGLSAAFHEELKNTFTIQQEEPSDFQILFPEFCIPAGTREASGDFITPARRRFRKEPTFWSSSIVSRLPGWHCDVLKLDDVVNPENSENAEQREKVIRRVNMARKLRDPGGYIDVIGTPYDVEDYYSYQRQHASKKTFVFISHAAWGVKAEARGKELTALAETDVESYYFPARLDWAYLKNELDNDPESFASQYLLDATKKVGAIVKFTDEILDAAEVPWQSVSVFSSYYAIWDLAYGVEGSVKNKPCLTAGAIEAKDSQGRLTTVELIAGYYGAHEIAPQIVDAAVRHPLQYTGIEDAPGVRWLEPQIQEEAKRRGLGTLTIVWIPVDHTENAKRKRIALVPGLMHDKRMLISDACINKDFLREQLSRYTGRPKTPMDVADVLGLAAVHLGNYTPAAQPEMTQEEYEGNCKIIRDRAMREVLFPSAQSAAEAVSQPEQSGEGVVNYF